MSFLTTELHLLAQAYGMPPAQVPGFVEAVQSLLDLDRKCDSKTVTLLLT